MVIWSAPARADLHAIHDTIARDSRHYAKKVAQEIAGKTDILGEFPRIGRVVPELGDENVRQLSIFSNRILYEITGDDVYVLAVIHRRRDLQADMIER